jgi:hypothetical protein
MEQREYTSKFYTELNVIKSDHSFRKK